MEVEFHRYGPSPFPLVLLWSANVYWYPFAHHRPIVQGRYLLWDVRTNSFIAGELRGDNFHLDNGKIVTPENNLYFSHYTCVPSPVPDEVERWKTEKKVPT